MTDADVSDAAPTDGGIDRVLVAGATGKTGRHVLEVLAARGYERRAITRSADRAERLRARGVEAVVGDLREAADAARAVAGVDAVVTAVGTGPLDVARARVPGVASPGQFVDGAGNVTLLRAAEDAGVGAFVMCSSLGVDGDRASWMARAFALGLGPIPPAKARAERAIRGSGLRHTILRPGVLLDRLAGLAVGALGVGDREAGVWGVVSRRDVAALLVAALSTPAAADRTFEVARNPFSVGETVDVDWEFGSAHVPAGLGADR